MKTKQQLVREELAEILNSGASGDLDAVGCHDYNPQLLPKIMAIFTREQEEIVAKLKSFDISQGETREATLGELFPELFDDLTTQLPEEETEWK